MLQYHFCFMLQYHFCFMKSKRDNSNRIVLIVNIDLLDKIRYFIARIDWPKELLCQWRFLSESIEVELFDKGCTRKKHSNAQFSLCLRMVKELKWFTRIGSWPYLEQTIKEIKYFMLFFTTWSFSATLNTHPIQRCHFSFNMS